MTHIIEFPLHIGDFLTGVQGMDAEEVGAYVLLIIAHVNAGDAGLEDNDERLARCAHVTPHVWKRLRPLMAEKFQISNGRWTHERVIKTRRRIEKKSSNFFAVSEDNPLNLLTPTLFSDSPNHQPITIDDKTPLPPLPVDNSKAHPNGYGAVVIGGRIFNIADHLTDFEWREMTALRPAWDRHALIRRYNAWIADKGIPRSPRAAFVGWLKTQPEKP